MIIDLSNVHGTWVHADALRGIIDSSSQWAVTLDGDDMHGWMWLITDVVYVPDIHRADDSGHWLVLDALDKFGNVIEPDCVIPLREVRSITF